MQREAAERLLERALCHAFDEDAFRVLVRNVFKDPDEKDAPALTGAYIYDSFRGHVRQFKRIAKYTDAEGEEIDVLAVELHGGTQLERARTMQRNFAAEYLKRKEREAALVAYYTAERSDWRLSFVRLEYRAEVTEAGTIRTTPELTPARRYSFLVGEGEPTHTAQQQLFSLLTSETPPSVDGVEHAFEIERVTKAFFAEYKELFLDLKEDLDDERHRLPAVEGEFQRCGLTSEGFAKKLLGQIVFLYFIQKKGWLGVPREAAWGEGPRDFLRRLFDKQYGDYSNFFDDRLEPLFYEALATERGADSYYHAFDCRIPFLNGGLFEPPGGYAWEQVPLHLPDGTFEKVFDTFDRYNFTVREDEPLEKEVAVDPEMLGKVFENLLEVKDRKAKGAFYTPRKIVAYMCNESLIAYLDDALNGDGAGGRRTRRQALSREAAPQNDMFRGTPPVQGALAVEEDAPAAPRTDLEALVREGERWAENDRRVREAGRETDTYRWAAPEAIRTHAAAIDQALEAITICDPAIGSGAFPVGMMQAVIRVREALTPYLDDDAGRSAYVFKRHAIQHSLYGVDIEPSAVDIAQLRLWLSLVVDEDDFQTIQPLPNLRYKIVEGDALGGIEHLLENNEAYDRLQQLIPQHVEASSPVRKERLQQEIDTLIEEVTGSVFDFGVYFGDVLHKHGGFDVVIGNPPYVRQESLTQSQKKRYESTYQVYAASADLYSYFIERGMQLLRPGGVFAYIVSNKWLRTRYGTNLRNWLKDRRIVEIIDFGDLPVFQGATTYPCVLRLERRPPASGFRVTRVEHLDWNDLVAYVREHQYLVQRSALRMQGWGLATPQEQKLLKKLHQTGEPLADVVGQEVYYGIKTGYNKAFVINAATRARLIAEDPRSSELIKPFLAGRDIKRYRPPTASNYVILIRSGWTDDQTTQKDKWAWLQLEYPAIARHLAIHRERAKQRYDQGKYWWELRPCSYYDAFERPKILYVVFQVQPSFTFDTGGTYANNAVWIMPTDRKYLLAILNSRLGWFLISNVCTPIQGGYQLIWDYFGKVPVPLLPTSDDALHKRRDEIERSVDEMLALCAGTPSEVAARQADISRVEQKLNSLVYALYGLTEDEIALVERSV